MQVTHCDMCREEIKIDSGKLWSNKLPANDRMRNLYADIKFFGDSHSSATQVRELDLCRKCQAKFFRACMILEE